MASPHVKGNRWGLRAGDNGFDIGICSQKEQSQMRFSSKPNASDKRHKPAICALIAGLTQTFYKMILLYRFFRTNCSDLPKNF
jgi:hypothetical protein